MGRFNLSWVLRTEETDRQMRAYIPGFSHCCIRSLGFRTGDLVITMDADSSPITCVFSVRYTRSSIGSTSFIFSVLFLVPWQSRNGRSRQKIHGLKFLVGHLTKVRTSVFPVRLYDAPTLAPNLIPLAAIGKQPSSSTSLPSLRVLRWCRGHPVCPRCRIWFSSTIRPTPHSWAWTPPVPSIPNPRPPSMLSSSAPSTPARRPSTIPA